MKKVVISCMVAALMMASALPAAAGDAGHIEYELHTLDNGLRVILSEDHSVPIVAVNVWYHVGSGYEEEGRRFYKLAAEHHAARELSLSRVFWTLHGNFQKARKPLNFIADHYLHYRKLNLLKVIY